MATPEPSAVRWVNRFTGMLALYSLGSTILYFYTFFFHPALPTWWNIAPLTGLGRLFHNATLLVGESLLGINRMKIWEEPWILLTFWIAASMVVPLGFRLLMQPICARARIREAFAREGGRTGP